MKKSKRRISGGITDSRGLEGRDVKESKGTRGGYVKLATQIRGKEGGAKTAEVGSPSA